MRKRLRHLPASLLTSLVVLAVGAPIGWYFDGAAGAWGVLAGVGLVVFSYVFSSVVVAWGDLWAREMLLGLALLTYAFKFTLFGLVMYRVAKTGWDGLPALGFAVLIGTIVWTSTQLYWILNQKLLYVEIEES